MYASELHIISINHIHMDMTPVGLFWPLVRAKYFFKVVIWGCVVIGVAAVNSLWPSDAYMRL